MIIIFSVAKIRTFFELKVCFGKFFLIFFFMKISILHLTNKNIFKSDKKNTKILEGILVYW